VRELPHHAAAIRFLAEGLANKLQKGWSLPAIIALVLLVEVDEDTTDPAKWGVNWPKQHDSCQRTAIAPIPGR
jgi:hypothetical protein